MPVRNNVNATRREDVTRLETRETCLTTSVFISESELPKTKYGDNPELGELLFVFFSFLPCGVISLGFVVKVPLQRHVVFRFRIGEENVGTAREVRYCIVLVMRVFFWEKLGIDVDTLGFFESL